MSDDTFSGAHQDFGAYCLLMGSPSYTMAPHHHLIADTLEKVERGEIKRLIISMPPRHGKTMEVSEFFPAWYFGRHPDHQIIQAGYSDDLAAASGRKVRDQFLDPIFHAIFPRARLNPASSSCSEFATTEKGLYRASGIGGSITGRGAHILIIDDPIKNREEAESQVIREKHKAWFSSTAYTRLMPGGAIILVLTRWHVDDLAGWQLKEHADEGWTVLSLKAIAESNDPLGRKEGEALWPGQFSAKDLARIKRALSPRDWAALYQQSPYVPEGEMVKLSWFWRYQTLPAEPFRIIQSWDTANKAKTVNDFSVCTTWFEGPRGVALADVLRARLTYPALKRAAISKAAQFHPHVILIEDKGSGQSLIQDLREATVLPIVPIDPGTADKVIRMSAASGLIEAGKAGLPESAPWLADYELELVSFPGSENDDQVDSTSQFLTWWRPGAKFQAFTGNPLETVNIRKGFD